MKFREYNQHLHCAIRADTLCRLRGVDIGVSGGRVELPLGAKVKHRKKEKWKFKRTKKISPISTSPHPLKKKITFHLDAYLDV